MKQPQHEGRVDLHKAFQRAWRFVTRDEPSVSSLMKYVGQSLNKILAGDNYGEACAQADEAARRIADLDRIATCPGGCITEVKSGEWHVSNADLELWRDVSYQAKQAGFPEAVWKSLAGAFSEAIHAKRTWQAWLAYQESGLTADHIRVAAALRWDASLWRGDGVTIYVQGKRPFGNSGVECDIAAAAGWPLDWPDDEGMPVELQERCWDLFDQLRFAVPEILDTAAYPLRPT